MTNVVRLPFARRHLEWGAWKCRAIPPVGIISFYIDLNAEGVYLGGSLWRFEAYIHLTIRPHRVRVRGEAA